MMITTLGLLGLCLAAGMAALMWAFPAPTLWRPHLHRPCWGRRLLAGEFGVNGTLALGLAGLTALWWCLAAGLLTSPRVPGGLGLVGGGGLLVALFNAGRRARWPWWGCLTYCLCLLAGAVAGTMWGYSLLTGGINGVH